jgi:hypothetical protein
MGLDLQYFGTLRPMLYHGTASVNLASIRSTRVLTSAALLAPDRRHAVRSAEVIVKTDQHVIALRDQLALRQGHVELTGGWYRRDLIAALNSRVFFWPGDQNGPNGYGRHFFDAYRRRGHKPTMLRVHFFDLLKANPDAQPYFCRFNSGAPRTSGGRKSPRGPDTFQDAGAWEGSPSRVAEVSFVSKVLLPRSTEVWDHAAGWQSL